MEKPTSRMPALAFIGLCLAVVSGCSASFDPPASVRGEIPITVANNTPDTICHFEVGPKGGKQDDWIGMIVLGVGKSSTAKLKAGTYRIDVRTCGDRTTPGRLELDISHPTFLAIGSATGPVPPPSGFAVRVISVGPPLPVFIPVSADSCLADGQISTGAERCCHAVIGERKSGTLVWRCVPEYVPRN